MKPKKIKLDSVSEATRPLYLITSSIEYSLKMILQTKNKKQRLEFLARIEDDGKYLTQNIRLLKKEINLESK